MEGLIGINRLKKDATIAKTTVGNSGTYYYTIIPALVRKCSYLVTIMEDRRQPRIYVVSKYDINYKYDYNVITIVEGYSLLSIKFYYNSTGDFILSIGASSRGAVISVKLLIGDNESSIVAIVPPESDLIEIPIS